MLKKLLNSIIFLCMMNIVHAQQNTIIIIADDVSPDYFGSFSTTTDTAKAPNIRTLANKGIRFTTAWSAPVCSPARAGIFTGRYPFRTGVGGVISGITTPQLDSSEMSIAKLLKYYAPVKYNTACVGKWHLNSNTVAKRVFPNALGFNFYKGNFNGAIPDYFNYQIVRNGVLDTITSYATTQTVNDAIGWLDTMNTTKPFFLWVAFNAPHSPYHIPPASLCNTAGLTGTTADINANPEKYFKAAIEAMDTEIGRLFAYLTANNLMDSTNIIFIGDNGNQSQVAQITNTAKSKGTIYNYGVHIPMIIAGPAVVNGNRNSNELINTPDLFATIAELCGFSNWKNNIPTGVKVDSKSMMPIIKNQTITHRTWIFSETFNTPVTAADGKTIRNQDYQLLRFDDGKEEFYNITLDKEENNNLLLNTTSMTTTDVTNYHFLCDSISALTGVNGCQPLAIGENFIQNQISIYPNPIANNLIINIANTTNAKATIINTLGQVMLTAQLNTTKNNLNIATLQNGVYYLVLHYDDKIITKQFVKQ